MTNSKTNRAVAQVLLLHLHALVRRNKKKSKKQSSSTVLVTRVVTRRGGSASARPSQFEAM